MAEQVAANPVDVEPVAMPAAEPQRESLIGRAIDSMWRLLRRPWLLVALLALLGATLLWARMIPQIPGQLAESAADATRWLNATFATTSVPGAELARSLGLFDLYASPWLRVLLSLVTLLAAVQVADALDALYRWRGASFEAATGKVAEPVTLAPNGIVRERIAVDAPPERVAELALDWAEKSGMAASTFVRVAAPLGELEAQPALENMPVVESAEQRFLFRKRGWSVWLTPLLSLGALVAALLLWANVFWAWNLRPDVLAPGGSFESVERGVALRNDFDPERLPGYTLEMNGEETVYAADGQWHMLPGFGAPRVRANGDIPALMVQADDALLALPNAPKPQDVVGVLLPALGSEQFIVLPGEGIGLRLVRISDGIEEQYWAEVYDEESVQPIVRQQIEGPSSLEVPIVDQQTLTLQIAPAQGLQVEIQRSFGRMLWLPALLMILAGIIALILPARLLLAQISPWEKERTLLIAQGTSAKEVNALVNALQP